MRLKIPRGAPPLLFTFILLTAVLSCKKSPEEPTITGRVTEAGTNKPLPNAKVKLLKYSGTFLGNSSTSVSDTTISDADGNYTLYYTDPATVMLVEAYKNGYFSDDDSWAHVPSRPAQNVDVTLFPHAWLRIILKNESGAYGIYPQANQSGISPIRLEVGHDTSFIDQLSPRKGNRLEKYLFSVRETEGVIPNSDYWQKVRIFIDDQPVIFSSDFGAKVEFYLLGHDTTNLKIIY